MSVAPRRSVLTVALVGLALASVLVGVSFGSVRLSFSELGRALLREGPAVSQQIVWGLRLPRVGAAFVCGALLAQAGALLQVLLRNPLADPYILGVSGGAAVGALSAMALGATHFGIDLAALAGAGAVIALVFAIGVRTAGANVDRLLLTGVVIAAGLGAVVSLFLVLAPAAQIHGMLFWLMGDLSRTRSALLPFAVLCIVALAAILIGPRLNVLALGEIKAQALGLNVARTQVLAYFLAAAATAAAVVTAGSIGFVGLLAPHVVRLAGVADQRVLLPLAGLLGGSLLTLADVGARSLAAPIQLPVGALTALLGVPALLILLIRRY